MTRSTARRHWALLFIGVLGLGCTNPAAQPTVTSPPKAAVAVTREEEVARRFLDELSRGQFAHPATPFTAKMAEAMPPAKVEAVWRDLEAASGRYTSTRAATLKTVHGGTVVALTCGFERTEKLIRLTIDGGGAVAGIFYGPSEPELDRRTRAFLLKAAAGDFVGANAAFGPSMRSALPPPKLAATWKGVEAQAGALEAVESVALKPAGDAWFSLATARFQKARMVVKLVYDARDEVVGLFFRPADVPWSAPDYVRADAFEEREVVVGSAPSLPATLTMPKTGDALAAVILVHGSGPADRDESVGAIKVFKDLAMGLASRGVAVLRYEKRSRQAPAGVVTEQEEVLDGARAALALLRSTPRISPQRIFVVGHSQGGNLAPRIAKADGALAGIVILAGSTRPLQDLLIDQYAHFVSLHPEDASLKKKLEEAHAFKARVESPDLQPEGDPRPPTGGGMTGAYFLFQRGYDPVTTVKALAMPALILQGERDYQVTSRDFERWKKGLADVGRVTLKSYPSLNHLFVRGTGTPRPEEYDEPGHVEEAVVTDIAEWIGKARTAASK